MTLNLVKQFFADMLSTGADAAKPRLSIILAVYKMPSQAINTLTSLMTDYQVGVDIEEYEVIVV